MQNKLLKIFTVLFILSTILQQVPARAAPMPDEVRSSITTKLQGLEDTLDNKYGGQEGLYYNLYYLTLKVQWTNFVQDFNKTMGLGFADSEKDFYWEELVNDFKRFNTTFGSGSGRSSDGTVLFEPLQLNVYTAKTERLKMAKDFTAVKVPAYLKARMNAVHSQYTAASSDEDRAKIVADNRDSLRYIYRILNTLINESEEMKLLMPDDAKFYIPGSPEGKTIWQNSSYQELLNKGRAIDAEETNSLAGLEEVNSKIYLEKLAWVKKKSINSGQDSDLGYENWNPITNSGTSGTDYRLRDSYVRMFSASAVYRPMVSYVGDEDFLAALGSLFDDTTRASMLQLYQEVKDYRKPLYSMYDGSKWYEAFGKTKTTTNVEASVQTYSGKGSLLTLSRFMKDLEDEALTGLIMHKGKLKLSDNDINTYFYFNDNPKFGNSGQEPVEDNYLSQDPVPSPSPEPTASAVATSSPTADPSATPVPGDSSSSDGSSTTDHMNDVLAAAADEISSTKWTSALVEVGARSGDMTSYPVAGTTLAALRNYYKDLDFLEGNGKNKDSFLFMNVFGDIVTKDNLVVVPGASNPLFFNQEKGYFPYNVTFMSGYPSVYNRGEDMILGNEADKGKYLLASGGDEYGKASTFVKIKGKNDISTNNPQLGYWINLKLAEPIAGAANPFQISDLDTIFGSGLGVMWSTAVMSVGFMKDSDAYKNVGLVLKTDLTVNGASLMKYDPSSDEDFRVAKYIARNVYYSFNKTSTDSAGGSGRLREDFLFKNVMVEAMNGTIYTEGYTKVLTETMDYLKGDSYGWWKDLMYNFGSSVLDNMGRIDGVLGVKQAYQDSMFASIRAVIDKFLYYILLIILLGFIFQYMRNGSNFLYTIVTGTLVIAVAFVFLKIVPVYLPSAYNFIANNTNRQLSYEVLYTKSEKYFQTYKNTPTIDDKGNFKISTTSADLYRLSQKQLKEVVEKYGLSHDSLTQGKMQLVDGNTGLYLQGDRLKVNIDTLLSTNPITGSYSDTEYGTAYQLSSDKMFSSVIDYYTPYYLIEDGFVDTLNRLLMMYNIPRYSITYGAGLVKDSYVVYNYINSPPFLTPGEYVQEGDTTSAEEVEKLYLLFDNPEEFRNSVDFLNLHGLLTKSTPEMENSLWYRTMVQSGIDPKSTDPVIIKRYNNLIQSVNGLTKDFMIKLKSKAGQVSDENMIKIISLYATTVFDQKISETFGNNVYPKNLNYEEFKLQDVFLSVFTEDYAKFLNNDRDVMYYMRDRLDGFTYTIFILTVVLAAISSAGLQFALGGLYVALGVICAARLIGGWGSGMKNTFKGYFKSSIILFLCLTLFVTTLGLRAGKDSTWSVYIVFFVCSIILGFMLTVLGSILLEPANLGNSKINSAFMKMAKLPFIRNAVEKLLVSTTRITRSQSQQQEIADRQKRYLLTAKANDFIREDAPDLSYLEQAANNMVRRKSNRAYLFDADDRIRRKIAKKDNQQDIEDIL